MNRDNYFRCKVCKKLYADTEGVLDTVKGLQCPRGCEPVYNQPSYESPLISE